MTAHKLTADEVAQLNFSQIVGFVNEPNMCSGGAATLRRIMREVPGLHPEDL
ncbi:hypothetical protein AB0B45_47900 [Nonomuraea sp. NPDC049152]|uniref:hypothetical protein n=1 Tax=Nonomuraea sp. NPDC049152 TaxID=3154350 RepID=UPI0033E2B8F2